jgi:aryl-alcohol dehydrogenase-like predicted oxidoreductase
VKTRRLGHTEVSAIGLGCMNVSWKGRAATDPVRRRESAIPGFHRALDEGITLLDTANIYAPTWDQIGHNEIVVREAFDSWSGSAEAKAKVVLATKGGITRSVGEVWGRNGSFEHLLTSAEASRERLKLDVIPLYQHHRLDPHLDLESQVEAMGKLKERGIIDQIGVSNYSLRELTVALDILGGPEEGGVVSVQNELSPFYRHDLDVLELCESRGIAFLPWSPLGGSDRVERLVSGEVGAFAEVANSHGISVPRLVIAWLLAYSPVMIPLPGATREETVSDAAAAVNVELTDDEVAKLTASLPESEPRRDELDPPPPLRAES